MLTKTLPHILSFFSGSLDAWVRPCFADTHPYFLCLPLHLSHSPSLPPSHLAFGSVLAPAKVWKQWCWTMIYRLQYFFIGEKDWDLAAFVSFKWFRVQREVQEAAFVFNSCVVKKRNNRQMLSQPQSKELFFVLSLFPCFPSDNTLTCNAERRMEIKWGLRFRLIWAIFKHAPDSC